MGKIAVSACLVGKNTKYNGGNNYNESVIEFIKDKDYILICPEVFGGLPTPRHPSEIINNKVINKVKDDVTTNFVDGANIAFKMLIENNVTTLILKSNSPSCGYKKIYDGTFSGKLIDGNGIFTELASKHNFEIFTEKDIEKIMKK